MIAGIGLAICLALAALLAAVGLWAGLFSSTRAPESPRLMPDRHSQLIDHSRWLAQLRWVAAGCVFVLILLAVPLFDLLPLWTLPRLLAWLLVLVVANAIFSWRIEQQKRPEQMMALQVGLDLVVLTGLLNASGGVENPLYFGYVFPIIVGATLLSERYAFALTLFGCLLFCLLSVGEALHILPHVTLDLFPHSNAGTAHASHDASFVAGKSVSLVVLVLVSSYLTALLRRRLRESEEAVSRSAREARLEHERLESMVQAAGVGMIVVEPRLRIRWFSRRASSWLGWSQGVIGQRCPLFEAENGCRECVALEALQTGRPAESERELANGNSGTRYFRHAAEPVRDRGGRVFQVVELVEDITRRKALETEAVHAGKLSVLGQLAAGLAHEIGNPIASLTTRLERMERRRDQDFIEESLTVFRSQIERIGRTIRNVSAFSRLPPQERRRYPVNAIIVDALELLRLDPRVRRIKFEQRLIEPSPEIFAVRDQISQVILNLLLNSIEAISGDGTIRIESRLEKGQVMVDISDTGSGIPLELKSQVFEPFITTKAEGVGLGLAITKSLIQAHGGTIDVDSEAQRGTCFSVTLPRSDTGSSKSAAAGVER